MGPFNLSSILRPELQEMIPYDAPRHPEAIRLDANENPFPFPGDILEKIKAQVHEYFFTRYPDPRSHELVAMLADYTGVSPAGIMVGNGSDEVILTLLLTFASGGRVIITPPTFSMYKVHSLIAGAVPVEVPRHNDFILDISRINQAAAHPDTRLIFICSPNNPTGNAAPVEDIKCILEETTALTVVDEAYIEFGGESCIPLLAEHPNLVILRTFSKAFGIAGLRVGYLLSNPAVVQQLLRVKQPYNLNVFSQLAARMVLYYRAEFLAVIKKIIQGRQILSAGLCNIPGVEVFPSAANFIFFRTAVPASILQQDLLKEGVSIRDVSGPGLERGLRVTVGQKEENKTFLTKLKLVLTRREGQTGQK
jgi:histidinol-phosphate aminotransferase